RKFDTNNDGRIQAPEFDRRFKELTGFGGKLTLTKSAVQPLPATTADVSITLVRFFTNLDKNRDDRLSDAEWKPVEETLVTLQRLQFTRLDLNMSGDLTLSELAVLDDLIKALHKGSAKKPSGKQRRPLPEELRAADLDADSLLSERELARALVRIHLTLARLAKQIIQRADTDGDQHLNAVEVQAARITRPARKPWSRRQRR
ncbi:MAG: hypothetical protein QGG14_10030, partial [Planctomycetota bacterium]|nr:hypothetical protein [Planctomycetota bacterium]